MPLPPAVGKITIAFSIQNASVAANGVIKVLIPTTLYDTTDHVILAPCEIPAVVVNGVGSVEIPDPNDPDVSPQGWAPRITIDTDVLKDTYDIVIPPGTPAGSTVYLSNLGRATSPPVLVMYALASDLLNYVPKALVDGKGELIVGTADNAVTRLPAGSNGQALVVDDTTPTGLKWAASGGSTPDATTTVKGIVQLAGDLAGTAAAPLVPALATKQPLDPDLTAIAGLTPTANDVIQYVSGAWANRTIGQLKTSLALTYADVTGTVPTSALPPLAINETFVVADQAAMLALTAQRGDMAIRQDNGRTYVLSTDSPGTLADWKEVLAAGQVQSVAGKTGVVVLVKADVGLGSVDNTPDASKPVSGPQQTALDTKVDKSTLTAKGAIFVASGAGTPAELAVGSDGQVPTADATQPTGIKWATPSGGGGASFQIIDTRITSGNVAMPDTAGAWAKPGDANGLPLDFVLTLTSVQVGDWVEIGIRGMRNDVTSAQVDIGVQVGSSVVRYLSTGTNTPAFEGDTSWYPNGAFRTQTAPAGFYVTSGDLDSGQIHFVLANKSAGSGTLYASSQYPFWWVAKRWRQ